MAGPEYCLTRAWGDHGDVSWGNFKEMESKYCETISSAYHLPYMRLSHSDSVLRVVAGEWRDPDEWIHKWPRPGMLFVPDSMEG